MPAFAPAPGIRTRSGGAAVLSALLLVAGSALDAGAERLTLLPISDEADGQLVDGVAWDWRPAAGSIDDLLLTIGSRDGSGHAVALAFPLDARDEGESVADARLRITEQGGNVGNGFVVRVTGARSLDPLATGPGVPRFALPRTTASVDWSFGSPWDSSGQLVGKWDESPNLAPILNELLALDGWGDSPRVAQLFLEVVAGDPGEHARFDDTHSRYWNGGNAGLLPARLIVADGFLDAFAGRELLCRPRPDRMEINLVPHEDAEILVEWGPEAFGPVRETGSVLVPGGRAHHVVLPNLAPGETYVYRVRARPAAGAAWETGETRRFRTLPGPAQPLRFVATADLHVTNTSFQGYTADLELLERTLDLALARGAAPPDFWLDLGDLVVIRASRVVFDEEETEQRFREAREYVERIGHSVPFVFVRGNHEEVTGWEDDGSGENGSVWSGRAVLKWLAPPVPDDFYSGNEIPHPDIGLPGNYFAFTAGRLRLRAADPYLATTRRPHNGHGEVDGSEDGWDWTLGDAQYAWLARDLADHPEPFGVFALHHLTSTYAGPGRWYGRGGVEVAKHRVSGRPSFEWGGQDETGADVLASRRPGFEAGAPHDLLVAGGNQVLVKGHDHFAAIQELDGMLYLTLPKPDDTGLRTGDLWGWQPSTWYSEAETIFRENSGFFEIRVAGSRATWEYVRTWPEALFGATESIFTIEVEGEPGPPGIPPTPAPSVTRVSRVSPNPFRLSCRIEIEIGRPGRVIVDVVDAGGRHVARLFERIHAGGTEEVLWDGRDDRGRRAVAGVYFAVVRQGSRVAARQLVALR